jgi:hypothetical protein
MHIRLSALLWGLGWLGVLLGLAGAWPTWRLRGADGLWAQFCAGAVVIAAIAASGLLLRGMAKAGPAMVALGFLAAMPFRVAACCLAGMLLVTKYPICAETFFTWLGVFYLAMMLQESAWVSAALRRDADRVSLGEIRRPCRQIWDRHRIR